MKRTIILVSVLMLMMWPFRLLAGWLITGKYIDAEGKTYLHKVFIEGKFIKVERYNFIYICNLETGGIILVDPENLLYCQTDLKEYRDQSAKLMLERLNILLEEVPENERAQVKKEYESAVSRIGALPPPFDSLEYAKTRDTLVMSGYRTEKYTISAKGRRVEEVWIAPAVSLKDEMPWDKFFPYLVLLENQSNLVRMMTSQSYRELLQQGYPMRKMMYEGGSRAEWQVNKLEKQNIPDYEFYTPVMCRKITITEWLSKTRKTDYEYDDYE